MRVLPERGYDANQISTCTSGHRPYRTVQAADRLAQQIRGCIMDGSGVNYTPPMSPTEAVKHGRILVTGGGGFLGNHVLQILSEHGYVDIVAPRQADYDLTE